MTYSVVISFLAGSMLLVALLMVGRMRLSTLTALFRVQAILLSLYAFVLAVSNKEEHLIVIAVVFLGVNAFLIPRVLLRVARGSGVSHRLEAYARPTTLTFAGIFVSCLAFAAARATFPAGIDSFVTSVACSLVLLGLLMLISRKDMFGEAFGFLMLENGVFTFGLGLSGGMPLLVEIGVLFDLLVLFMLVAILVRRAQEEHHSVTTDYLRELVD